MEIPQALAIRRHSYRHGARSCPGYSATYLTTEYSHKEPLRRMVERVISPRGAITSEKAKRPEGLGTAVQDISGNCGH